MSHWTRRRERNELRLKWGGKCQRCGYSGCLTALQFHHLYPELKGERSNAPIGEIKRHPERFQLVCSNCSHELHDAVNLVPARRTDGQEPASVRPGDDTHTNSTATAQNGTSWCVCTGQDGRTDGRELVSVCSVG